MTWLAPLTISAALATPAMSTPPAEGAHSPGGALVDDATAPWEPTASGVDGELVQIVGGEPSVEGGWPAVVAVMTLNEEFGCTGTLIADDLVLTAGHCGQGMEEVRVGTHDLVADPGEAHAIAESWVHPNHYATYDVAVYRIEPPVTTVEPVPLIRDCWVSDYLVDDGEGVIVGFGAIDAYATERPTALHEAIVPIVDAACENTGRGCNTEVSPGGELIAGGDGIDSCSGDSGGPLFLDTPEGLLLTGITSRAAVPTRTPCGDGGIYVRADAVADWIEEVADATLPSPDCAETNRVPRLVDAELDTTRLRIGAVDLSVDDPNPGQRHELSLAEVPEQGRAWIEGSRLFYQPDGVWHGTTSVAIEVTDDGDPPRSAMGEVSIRVRDVTATETGGCAAVPSGSAGLGGVWLALMAVRRRRGGRSDQPARATDPSLSSGGRRTWIGSRRP